MTSEGSAPPADTSPPLQVVPAVEESITVAHIVVEASSIAEEIGNASAIVGERGAAFVAQC